MPGGVDIEQSPFHQRWFLAAAGLVAVIAVAGAIVAVTHVAGGHSRSARGARVTPSTALAVSAPGRRAQDGTCGPLLGGTGTVPSGTPVGTRWASVGDMAEPSAPETVGPERHVDGFGECYAHSPLGALYASANVIAAFSAQPQSTVIATLAVPGPARDVAVRQAETGDDRDLEQLAGGPSTLIGFAFVSYAPQVADITVAVQGPQGVQGAVPLVLRWVGDDWRFVVPADGQQFAATQVTSMAGFVPWSAG